MATAKNFGRLAGGVAAAGLIIFACGSIDAHAARKRFASRRNGPLAIQTINVSGASGVPANEVIEVVFSTPVQPKTINEAVFQVREENATGTGFTKQIFGDFQIAGSVVRFFPRLPTNIRNPNDPTGGFYSEGSERDNAFENAGLRPSTQYEIKILGRPFVSPVKSKSRNRPLRRTYTARFSTAAASDPAKLYVTRTFSDSPPPQYSYSNPPDQIPQLSDQFTHHGGAVDVPNDLAVSLFCTRVPLSPATLRVVGNIELTMLERKGDPSVRRPIESSVFVEQNFSTTLLVCKPKYPLADEGTYSLRISKDVKDLTEQFDFAANRGRERLRAIYEYLDAARAFARSQGNPNPTGADLKGPPVELVPNWPVDESVRAILRDNVLDLGDTRPDELDARVMVIFSTRNEPVTEASVRIEFDKAEDLFDAKISTGEVDTARAPSAASAILTVAGGSAADGDFKPTGNTTLSAKNYAGGVMNFRDVLIPNGVTVTFTGDRPIQLRAINFTLEGTIDIRGKDGQEGSTSYSSNPTEAQGGVGGPGGGTGGSANSDYSIVSSASAAQAGYTGERGTDSEGTAQSTAGGSGGLGGVRSTGTYYSYGGGGGGGGARLPGGNGDTAPAPYASWSGKGGLGGAGSANDALTPLVGAAGGGAGGAGGFGATGSSYTSLMKTGAGAGGGGGGMNVQVARILAIGTTGRILATGGDGGDIVLGSYGPGGMGGGGGGGSILVRSGQGFNIANPLNAFVVAGGKGGVGNSYTYTNYKAGSGGSGYVRLEDPNGGLLVPGGTQGVFDPVGGGVPSFVYTKFVDLGVQDPRILNPKLAYIATDPTTNDAIFVEVQATVESADEFGTPDLSKIDSKQNTTDTFTTSNWMPLKVHDRTGTPGGVFTIPGYDPGVQGLEAVFPVDALNNRGFRFLRFRITFQLDNSQKRLDPIPLVDFIQMQFQFNF